jgi:hypothetical protein
MRKWRAREIRVSGIGFEACERCGLHAMLRTLDVSVPKLSARKGRAEVPAGWCPLIALCGICWTDAVKMLRDAAIPDSSGAVSP